MSGPGDRGRRVNLLLAVLVGIVVAAVGVWAQNESLVGVNYDDGIYALLAKALAEGDGYRLTFLPTHLPGVKYPPLYPLSLVPYWKLAGSQEAALHAMKMANGVYIGIAAATFVFLLMDLGVLAAPLAVIVALVGFVAGSMMLVVSGLMSESLYLALLFLALWVADRGMTDRRMQGLPVGRAVLIGVLAGVVFLTRSVGVALVAAVLFAVWRRHGRRTALVVAAAAAAVALPWSAYAIVTGGRVPQLLVPRYGSYGRLYAAMLADSPLAALDVAAINVGAILQTLGGKLGPQLSPVLQSTVGAVLIVLAVLGSRRVFARAPATATYAWLYLIPVSFWVFPPFRFVFIHFPLLLALAAAASLEAARWIDAAVREKLGSPAGARRAWARLAVLAAGAVLLTHLAYMEFRAVRGRVWDGAELLKSAAAQDVVDWVMENTEPQAVVAFEFDPAIALHTGRPVIPNNYEPVHAWYRRDSPSADALARLLHDMGARYVAVRRYIPAATAPLDEIMGRYPGSLDLVHVTPEGVLIFETNPSSLEEAGEAAGS